MRILFVLFLIMSFHAASAQDRYSDNTRLVSRIKAVADANPSICNFVPIVKTRSGRDIYVITVGTGDKDSKPGIAIIAGTQGNYLLGREIAASLAERLTGEYKALLEKVTFYIFPDVSPDATAQYFAPLKYERQLNANPTDDDKDFSTDEDPFEDLDNDGVITYVRVEDPAGNFVKNTEDDRVMVRADVSQGQTGGFLYFTEGTDNDDDGTFNEDGPGGVNFNKNFTYDYEEFGMNAGLHPVSEPEVKAVADFLYEKFNIYVVLSFGPQDNLGQPMKNGPRSQDRRITSIMQGDEPLNKLLSEKYHETTGLKGAPATQVIPGNFMDWAYYHFGRYSFSTPGWWFPMEKGKNAEAEFLKYADKNNLKDVFIPWKAISHPGFPGRKSEAGGIRPFAMINPPADSVDVVIRKNIDFITTMAKMHPELIFSELKTEKADDEIYRIEVKITNKGVFPTMAEVGLNNTWTRLMQLTLETVKGQEILSGRKVQRIDRLTGGESAEFSWLVRGKGSVKITAGAVNTGIISTSAELR